jgi:hypothetical protein
MKRYQSEFSNLAVVEQHLLNAAVSLRAAEHRLEEGQLRKEIRAILDSLAETVELAGRAKHIMLNEWRRAEVTRPAA